ncbi:hypothetical protein G6F61_014714 [Rhizopus arrhizus]|nr:hypothetical protein G6F61_014714 [Rhizopus arrhizus]
MMCWYMTGSPPPAALKNEVPKWRSVSVMVMAPASTGITAMSRVMPGARMFSTVAMMLIAPMIELMPATWIAHTLNATL